MRAVAVVNAHIRLVCALQAADRAFAIRQAGGSQPISARYGGRACASGRLRQDRVAPARRRTAGRGCTRYCLRRKHVPHDIRLEPQLRLQVGLRPPTGATVAHDGHQHGGAPVQSVLGRSADSPLSPGPRATRSQPWRSQAHHALAYDAAMRAPLPLGQARTKTSTTWSVAERGAARRRRVGRRRLCRLRQPLPHVGPRCQTADASAITPPHICD